MRAISSSKQFQQNIQKGASLVIFGGENCGVCQSIKPKLAQLIGDQFPNFGIVYVDCEKSAGICVQEGVFTLPVIKLYIDGQMHLEEVRHINLHRLTTQLERLYGLWNSTEN